MSNNMNKTSPLSAFFYGILTLLFNLAFTKLFANTFNTDFSEISFVVISSVIIVEFIAMHMMRKRFLSFAGLLFVVGIAGILIYYDYLEVWTGATKVYDYLRYVFTGALPYVSGVDHDGDSIALLLALVGAIPAFAATWAFVKRKTTVPAIILYLIYFLPVALDNSKNCATIWYILCGFGIMMLSVFGEVRRASSKNADKTMLLVGIPYLAICFAIALIFPMNNYNKDKTAYKQYNRTIVKIDKALGTNFKRWIAQMRGESASFQEATDILSSKLGTDVTTTDLKVEGLKNPREEIAIFSLNLQLNEGVDITDIDDLYLKNCAMSTFDGTSWIRNDDVPFFTNDENLYASTLYPSSGNLNIQNHGITSRYLAPIPNIQASSLFCDSGIVVPGNSTFTDGNILNDSNDDYGYNLLSAITYKYPESYTADEVYTFADYQFTIDYPIRSKNDPALPVPEWSSEYLEYVSEECTYVPGSTINSILAKEVLPEWYMSVLNGELEMNNADKVASVMNYVHSAKPYSLNTDFAPENEDFVAWFLSESKSGYCVHFASSTAVLLRMLGVPTRYVSGYYVGSPKSFINPTGYLIVENEMIETVEDIYLQTVTEKDAHAWCEYFDPDYGWVGFDPTSNRFISGYRPYTPGQITIDEIKPVTPTKPVTHESETEELTATPEPVEEPFLNLSDLLENKPLMTTLALLTGFTLVRLGYIFFWQYKFKRGSNNSRVRAYCRYSKMIAGHKQAIPAKMHHLTNVAMYSQDGASDENINSMRVLTREFLKVNSTTKPLPRRVFDKVFLSVPI